MMKEAIGKSVLRENLTEKEMEEVMREILERSVSDTQIASFITALRMKGETFEEITAAARVIRDRISRYPAGDDVVSLDREEITVERETILRTALGVTEGTNIFSISTATALVVAGGGLKVTKHGKRSSSPLCGSADVIEALGINLDMTATQLERCLKEVGVSFLYEPFASSGLGHITAIREKIAIRTIFNLLDPLLNPVGAKTQALGVYDPGLTETMARVIRNLGIERGLVFSGEDTLDEISITGKTRITEFRGDEMKTYFIEPGDFGMEKRGLDEIRGGTKKQNAEIVLEILKGKPGAKRDITVLNAAAVFAIAGRTKDFSEGIALGRHSIDSGKAFNKLMQLIAFTQSEKKFVRNLYELEMEQEAPDPLM